MNRCPSCQGQLRLEEDKAGALWWCSLVCLLCNRTAREWVVGKSLDQHIAAARYDVQQAGDRGRPCRLTTAEVQEARRRYEADDVPLVQLAIEYGVAVSTLADYIRGRRRCRR